MRKIQFLFFVIIAAIGVQLSTANVLFRFAIDFHVKSVDSSAEEDRHIDKTITFDNNHITITDNINSTEVLDKELMHEGTTAGPLESMSRWSSMSSPMSNVWLEQQKLNSVADEKLKATREALQNLNRELSPVVGRSDFVAAKVKLITSYLNKSEAADGVVAKQFKVLHEFVDLVDLLKLPPSPLDGGERSIEYKLISLALQKYEIESLQIAVQIDVLSAEEAWQSYVKTKLIEVAV